MTGGNKPARSERGSAPDQDGNHAAQRMATDVSLINSVIRWGIGLALSGAAWALVGGGFDRWQNYIAVALWTVSALVVWRENRNAG